MVGVIGSRVLALFVAIGLAIVGLVASAVLTIGLLLSGVVSIASLTGTSELGTGTIELVVLVVLATEGGFLLVGLCYVLWRLGLSAGIPTGREVAWIGGTVIVALVAANGLYALASELGLDPARGVFEPAGGIDPVLFLVIGALSIVIIGPAEELLFRGAIQGRLRRAFGPAASILLASGLFASFHIFNFGGSPGAVAFATGIIAVIGAVFGIAYERTGNLVVSILAHSFYNAILTVVAYVSAVGWV